MKTMLFCSLVLFFSLVCHAQDCPPARYRQLMGEADRAAREGKYDLAINKLQSAKTCQPDSEAVVNRRVVEVFREVNAERTKAIRNEQEAMRQTEIARLEKEKAEAEARRIFANDLAFKSQIALKDGDRTVAYHLAEMAQQYVDSDNPNVTKAFVEALYYNDDATNQGLYWQNDLIAPNTNIMCIAFSSDGRFLATGFVDDDTELLNLATGKKDVLPNGNSKGATSVLFSRDNKFIAIASYDTVVYVWNLQQHQCVQKLTGHLDLIRNLDFSPDGKFIITSSVDHVVKIWEIESGRLIKAPDSTSVRNTTATFSPDGHRIAIASDSIITIWDWPNQVSFTTLKGHKDLVFDIVFSPDGKKLASASLDLTVKIWDINSQQETQSLKGHSGAIFDVAFSPPCQLDTIGGKYLATASLDSTVRVWDLATMNHVAILKGYKNCVINAAFSPNREYLASVSLDNTLKIWNLNSAEEAIVIKGYTGSFSPDGNKIAIIAALDTVVLWDLGLKSELIRISDTSEINCIAFSPDGKYLATGMSNGVAKIWGLSTGKQVEKLFLHDSGIANLVFSSDGKRLVTSTFSHGIKVWDRQSGNQLMSLNATVGLKLEGPLSPDGNFLAIQSNDTIRVLNLYNGTPLITLKIDDNYLFGFTFSSNKNWIATYNDDNKIKIWDLSNSRKIMTLNSSAMVVCVAFSPDGNMLAAGYFDKTIKIWDLKNGREILTFKGLTAWPYKTIFSPDGTQLAVGFQDQKVKIFDLKSPRKFITHQNKTARLVGLSAEQLATFNLESLLDIYPDNEQKLISTGKVWQIKAFADLYTAQAVGSNILTKIEPYYSRADRLYSVSLALEDNLLIHQDYAAMLYRWAEVYESNGQEAKAEELRIKAERMFPESD